jgi:ribonuclease PH
MIDLKHDGDECTLRLNGRKFDENREINCQLGVMKNSSISGSALF